VAAVRVWFAAHPLSPHLMPHPFLIWTMRRTGGTSLASLFVALSGTCKAEHEPFNRDRAFGWVDAEFEANNDREQLGKNFEKALAHGPPFKHCYELFRSEFNSQLLAHTLTVPYNHLLLVREDECGRVLSLFLAFQTGEWKKPTQAQTEVPLADFDIAAMVEHHEHCLLRTREVIATLEAAKAPHRIAFFEDLYCGERGERLARVEAITRFMGYEASLPTSSDAIEEAIFGGAQGSDAVLTRIPNLTEAREKLEQAIRASGWRELMQQIRQRGE
jgi:hypothetical protein